MKRVALVALLLVTAQAAAGQEQDLKKSLAACASLGNETARLDCFERLTRAVARIPFPPLEPRVSKPQGSADVRTISPSEAANHIGEEVVVEGVICDVGHSARSDTTFLNFGGRYPNHTFTAVIFRSAKSLFPEARSWKGKNVRIKGVVRPYRGKPGIVLERAEQVTVPR